MLSIYDDFDPTGWLISEKLDGVCAIWDGESLKSRDGNRFNAPGWFTADLPSTPLEGELWIARGAFENVCSVVRSKNGGDRWATVRYMVFDGEAANLGSHAEAVEQIRCESAEQFREFYQCVQSKGGEGVVLKSPEGDCYKLKPQGDDDAFVIGHTSGTGRHAGRLGALVVRDREGREFRLGTGFSDADRRFPPAVGEVVKFTFQGRTKIGKPRHASFCSRRAESTLDF